MCRAAFLAGPQRGAYPLSHALEPDPMTQLLKRYLGAGDELARLHDHATRLRRLQTALEVHLPSALAGACSVANLKGDTLVLLASNGAAAAKLKQIAPSLIESFRLSGQPLKTIQVRVGVREERAPPRPPSNRSLSDAARLSLAEFSSTLPEDSPLRKSVERLIERSR
jgi:hypothetical protein